MVLKILQFPNPILRKPAEPVVFPLSKEIRRLTRDMLDTVHAADGIGLAAPQVGKSVQLLVVNLEKNGVAPFPLYNPRVVKRGLRKTEIEEGCLSIPGVFGNVKRPKQVTILAQNQVGEVVRITDDGWIARVAQHEIDHLNGRLIVDLIKIFTRGEAQVNAWRDAGQL